MGISVLFPLTLAISFLTGSARLYLCTMLAVCLHETGHVAVALRLGKTVSEIKVLPYGLNAVMHGGSPQLVENLAIYSGGPLMSILLFAIFRAGAKIIRHEIMMYAAGLNLFIALFNLVPVLPLDGGKLLREILGNIIGMNAVARLLRKISLAAVVIMISAAVTFAVYGYLDISLWAAAFFILLSSNRERTEGRIMSMQHILYRRTRLIKKGLYPVRHLAVLPSVRLGEIIGCMDYDMYHIVYELDPDMGIRGEYTEQQIIDGALKYGSSITLDEFTRKNNNKF